MRARSRSARGLTLLEAMIALAILLIGLVAMLQAQIFGMTSNQGSRAQSTALAYAEDLVQAIDHLPFNDATYLSQDVAATPAANAWATAPTSPFGPLLNGPLVTTGCHDEGPTGASIPPGAMQPSAIDPSPGNNGAGPLYHRRWCVLWWEPNSILDGNGQPPVKLISVSVIYHESTLQTLREVVLYTQKFNPATVTQNLQ